MKKKIVILGVCTLMACVKVNASSGRLKKNTIKTCNGVTYGQHSSDNHCHVAKEDDGNYYAIGKPIYSNPCNNSNSSMNNEKIIPSKQTPNKSSDNTLKNIII